jgi:hypothetical protein
MPVWERGHAFQVNKAALDNLPAEISLILDVFSAQLNSSLTVEGIISGLRWFFKERWIDFAHLDILLFHHSDGIQINNAMTAADCSILLPIIDDRWTRTRTFLLEGASGSATITIVVVFVPVLVCCGCCCIASSLLYMEKGTYKTTHQSD